MASTSVRTESAAWRSPAKVNLCLRITGRRDDGYHLLDSIFVPIDLCDRITLRVRDLQLGGASRVAIACDFPGVPTNDDNLAARAARVVLAEAGYGAEVSLTIEKMIPPGSGLGGGSGNAGTVLRHMNVLLGLGLTPGRLRELALYLGADVPFFLGTASARVRGIGEDVQPIAGWANLELVVAIPPCVISTAAMFRAFAALPECEGPDGGGGGAAGCGGEPARLAAGAAPGADLMVNDLERVVLPAFPQVAVLKRRMLAAGAVAAVLSGSGSAVVGLAPSRSAAERIAAELAAMDPTLRVHAARPIGSDDQTRG